MRDLDVVELLVGMDGHLHGTGRVRFPAGTRGTVVALYAPPYGAMIEVVRDDGTTAGFVDVLSEHVRVVRSYLAG